MTCSTSYWMHWKPMKQPTAPFTSQHCVGAAQHSPSAQHSVPVAQHIGSPGKFGHGSWPSGHGVHIPPNGSTHAEPVGQQVAPHAWLSGQQLPATHTSPAPQHWPLQQLPGRAQQMFPHSPPVGQHVPLTQVPPGQHEPSGHTSLVLQHWSGPTHTVSAGQHVLSPHGW